MRSVGVVTALETEAESIVQGPARERSVAAADSCWLAEHDVGVTLSVSGVGARRAGRAASELSDRGVEGLMVWGLAGGLDPARRAGDVLLPAAVVDEQGERFETDRAWHAKLSEQLGREMDIYDALLLSSRRVLESPEAKREAFERTGACAVDMESTAVARVAAERSLPFVVLRVVCDDAAMAIPPAALTGVDSKGSVRPLALAAALARRPGQLPELLRLRDAFQAASASLAQAGRLVGADPYPEA